MEGKTCINSYNTSLINNITNGQKCHLHLEYSTYCKVRDLGSFYKGPIEKYYFIQSSLKLFEVGTILIPVRLREAKWSRAHSQQMAVPGFKPESTWLQANALKNSALRPWNKSISGLRSSVNRTTGAKGFKIYSEYLKETQI